MGSFQVGVASRDITPPSDLLQHGRIWLWGYGEDGFPQRMTPSQAALKSTQPMRTLPDDEPEILIEDMGDRPTDPKLGETMAKVELAKEPEAKTEPARRTEEEGGLCGHAVTCC